MANGDVEQPLSEPLDEPDQGWGERNHVRNVMERTIIAKVASGKRKANSLSGLSVVVVGVHDGVAPAPADHPPVHRSGHQERHHQ